MTKKEKKIIIGLASALTKVQDSRDVQKLHLSVVNAAYILWDLKRSTVERAKSDLEEFVILL